MNGILNINKPANRTSFSIVAQVRRLSGQKRVGHAGTLDPMATGVLPVHIGQATRLVEYLMDTKKTYHAEIMLGAVTETYDGEGQVTESKDTSAVNMEQVEHALEGFRGNITQRPPVYSALKQNGRPLYQMARAGITVQPRERVVNIERIEALNFTPPVLTIEVDCGKGTYIRSLAHDLGQVLGCGAYLKSLARLRCGIFSIETAVPFDTLVAAFNTDNWLHFLYPMDAILTHLPQITVDEETARLIINGNLIQLPELPQDRHCRAYNKSGSLLGILKFDVEKNLWHPHKVFVQT